jgi:hypothetical protein
VPTAAADDDGERFGNWGFGRGKAELFFEMESCGLWWYLV